MKVPLWSASALSKVAAAVALACAATQPAVAVDVDAGDYVAAPAGTHVGLLYLQYAQRDKLYSDGNRLPGNNDLDSQVGIARYVHYTELGGYRIAPQILVPYGRLKAKGDLSSLGTASGLADTILALQVWFKNDEVTRTYWGVTSYLFVPTGDYDRTSALNLGENRWKFNLQTGYVAPITGNLALDLTGDVMFYGKNDDAGPTGRTLKQDPSVQLQGWLRYALSPTARVQVGLSQTWSGKTELDGVKNDDRGSTLKVALGGSVFVSPSFQLLATWGRDLSVTEGFKEANRINVRLLKVF